MKSIPPSAVSDIAYAAEHGDLEKVKSLLNDYPDLVFSRNSFGRTPLHSAASKRHRDVVVFLLANKADVNAKDNDRCTALHCVAASGTKEMVELLLANKAEVNVRDNIGKTPFYTAENFMNSEVVELLRQHGGCE